MDESLFPEETLQTIHSVNQNLATVSRLWQKFYNTSGKSISNADLAIEVDKRFRQLKLLLSRIVKLEERARFNGYLVLQASMRDRSKAPNELLKSSNKIGFQIELYTETCYYLAFRLICVAAKIVGNPKIKSGSRGVILVRNQFIEHSEKNGGITTVSFGHVGPYGPQVKPGRTASQVNPYLDPGLYKNMEEMLTAISVGLPTIY